MNGPEKSLQTILTEALEIEDAQRMMKGTGMIPCNTQLTEEYLGTSAKKGKFVDTLISTADFLVKQERLPKLLQHFRIQLLLRARCLGLQVHVMP